MFIQLYGNKRTDTLIMIEDMDTVIMESSHIIEDDFYAETVTDEGHTDTLQ